jgi:hypothetical protein
MGAGEEGVARGKAMDVAVLDQEIERPVHGYGRGAPAVLAEEFHHVVGAERLPRRLEHVERAAPAGGEPRVVMMIMMVGQVCLA